MCSRCGVSAGQYAAAMDVLGRHGTVTLLRHHGRDPADHGVVPPTDGELETSEAHIVRYHPVHCRARAVRADGTLGGWFATRICLAIGRVRRLLGLPTRYAVVADKDLRVTRVRLDRPL